jgi:hypothetical protein
VNLLFAGGYRKGLAATDGDHVYVGDVLWGLILVALVAPLTFCLSHCAVGKKGNPQAVRGPLWGAVVPGLRELGEPA